MKDAAWPESRSTERRDSSEMTDVFKLNLYRENKQSVLKQCYYSPTPILMA